MCKPTAIYICCNQIEDNLLHPFTNPQKGGSIGRKANAHKRLIFTSTKTPPLTTVYHTTWSCAPCFSSFSNKLCIYKITHLANLICFRCKNEDHVLDEIAKKLITDQSRILRKRWALKLKGFAPSQTMDGWIHIFQGIIQFHAFFKQQHVGCGL